MMQKLEPFLRELVSAGEPEDTYKNKGGRPRTYDEDMTPRTYSRARRKRLQTDKVRRIAILDMETDPFDNISQEQILPFLAVLYADEFDPIVIWEENYAVFRTKVVAAICALPERYIIYAHNGGRFDFLFLVSELRGAVSFKGRGLMSARIGEHELRDSFNIIPERLANYKKDQFDYKLLARRDRNKTNIKPLIIEYCIADCRYLLELVKRFHSDFGFKMTIGQAAMAKVKEEYNVKKLGEGMDEYLRKFFFGGRVECLKGRGNFNGDYKLYDTNSMYPYVMANYSHPIGDVMDIRIRNGAAQADTLFLDLECTNAGGLIGRNPETGETTSRIKRGRFFTTIWEFETACKWGLISNVKINWCVDCADRTNFERFVLPLYDKRIATKSSLAELRTQGLTSGAAYDELKKDDIFYKLLLNNAYGKFAQNPRNYKEHFITDPGALPPDAWFKTCPDHLQLPCFENDRYWLWEKPNPGFRFNNVGTAASITGAARAVLLDAMMQAEDAIYCDTDSIIARALPGIDLSETKLGAWKIEEEFTQVVINGKKLYGGVYAKPKNGQLELHKIRSKGASGLAWQDMLDLNMGKTVKVVNRAPTLNRYGEQYYITRNIVATAKLQSELNI